MLASCSKDLYEQLASESLLWWRIRNLYVATREYQMSRKWAAENMKPLQWWKDFVLNVKNKEVYWDSIDYRSIICWQIATSGKLDEEVFNFLYSPRTVELSPITGEVLIGSYLTKGWMKQARVLFDKSYVGEIHSDDVDHYISDNIECFAQGDHLELFKRYDRKYDTDYSALLKIALRHGASKVAIYLLDVLAGNNNCLCKFIEANNEDHPLVVCPLHNDSTLGPLTGQNP